MPRSWLPGARTTHVTPPASASAGWAGPASESWQACTERAELRATRLGIDEDTGIIIRGHLGDVVGRGSVTFVDGRGVRFDNADDCMDDGVALTLSYLRVGIVGAGYTFNLRERELETLVQMRSAPSPTEVLRGDGAAG